MPPSYLHVFYVQDVNMSALEKTDPNFAEETESCVLMPLVDADENSISGGLNLSSFNIIIIN